MEDLAPRSKNCRRIGAGPSEKGRISFEGARRAWRWQSKEEQGQQPPREYGRALKPALDQENLLTGKGLAQANFSFFSFSFFFSSFL